MQKKTVTKRIFMTNLCMVMAVFLFFILVNLAVVKIYGEMIEHQFEASLQQMSVNNTVALESVLKEYTVRRNSFYVILVMDALVCVGGLFVIGLYFTRRLSAKIEEPLCLLTDAAKRIQEGDYSMDVTYRGEEEFETACNSFNMMQHSILAEQDKIQQYEKARTDMIAGISHDLRTPLTAIRGTVKGLLDGVVSTQEQQQKFLQTAYRRTQDMNDLLERLFFFSKLETGNMPMHMIALDITAFLEEYACAKQDDIQQAATSYCTKQDDIQQAAASHRTKQDNMQQAAASHRTEKTVTIKWKVAPELLHCKLMLDPGQLTRILDNLVENSMKYAKVQELQLEISVRKEGQDIVISFADNGDGVEPEKLPHIFDEFYRGNESRSGAEGNGLGLYIVHYLVAQMNGRVSARNEQGLCVDMIFSSEKK